MKIHVLANYDRVDLVDACCLKRLIAERKIQAFRRSTGWVKIGVDAIRGDGGKEYDGPERHRGAKGRQIPLCTRHHRARS